MAAIGILPGFVWLIFFLREDFHPEPKRLIFYTFGVGVLASLPVFFSQVVFQKTIAATIGENTIVFIIGLALIEEIFKFLAAYFAVSGNPAFDEPVDAMIYLVVAGLGFATVENIFIAMNSASALQTATVTSLRFVGATLLHALTAALIGYQWALGIIQKQVGAFVVRGIIYATLVHALFNYLVLRFQEQNLFYSSLVILTAAFFVFTDFEKLRKQ